MPKRTRTVTQNIMNSTKFYRITEYVLQREKNTIEFESRKDYLNRLRDHWPVNAVKKP